MILSRTKTFLGVIFVVVLTVALHYFGILHPAEKILRKIISSPSKFAYNSSIFLRSNGDSAQIKCANREDYIAKMSLLSDENETLRRQLGFLSKTKFTYASADVVGRNLEQIGSTLIINRGQNDGIKKGQPVIIEDGIFIGKIARSEDNMAVIQLLNDGQSKVAATIVNNEKSIGIVEGGYGISIRMNFIPQQEAISPGDIVVTSGLEQNIPRGLVIGTIEAVEKEAYQPFQRAVLTTRAKLDQITLATVIIEKNN